LVQQSHAAFTVSLAGFVAAQHLAIDDRVSLAFARTSRRMAMLEKLDIASGLIRERFGSRDLDSSVSVISWSSPRSSGIIKLGWHSDMTEMQFVYCLV